MRCKRCWHIEIGVSHVHMTTSSSLWNEISHIYYVYSQKNWNKLQRRRAKKKLIIFTYVRSTHVSKPAECVRKNVPSSLSISLTTTNHSSTCSSSSSWGEGEFFFSFFFSIIIYFYALEKERNFLIVVVVDEISMMLGLESKI